MLWKEAGNGWRPSWGGFIFSWEDLFFPWGDLSSIEVGSSSLGRICSFLEDVSSSTYHCSSGNHYGLVAKPVFGQITIHTYIYIYAPQNPTLTSAPWGVETTFVGWQGSGWLRAAADTSITHGQPWHCDVEIVLERYHIILFQKCSSVELKNKYDVTTWGKIFRR